jgi:dTDP-4-amino-4,6-dideoxygalactose transaminase
VTDLGSGAPQLDPARDGRGGRASRGRAPGLEQLAVFGGTPAFSTPLHVGAPNVGDRARLLQRIEDILDRRWFTNNGTYVLEFERRILELVGVKHCVATCNGTVALEIMIRAVGLEGEVIVPAHTFVATPHALEWQRIEPVFCDVDPVTHNLDPERVEQRITARTTGILGVHLWGRGCDVEALASIADRHGLALVFDAAHAFGCSHAGRMIGGFGRAECFSFHATKFCSSFEGGAIVTNDDALAERMRLMRNFGFMGLDRVDYVGSNGKLTEVAAAMGLTSLESLEHFIDVNRRNHALYSELLSRVAGLSVLGYDERERNNYHYIVVEVDADRTGLDRDDLLRVLKAENVLARRYFYPGAHRMEPYRSRHSPDQLELTVTERLERSILQLPTGTSVEPAAIRTICSIIATACRDGAAVSKRLAADRVPL